MKYDLIISGAGPAGLMAARTSAEAGLRTLIVERKKEVAKVNRLCGQFTNISLINVGGRLKYGYTEPLNIEITADGAKLIFPAAGCETFYSGPLRPYMNYIYISPNGQPVYREKEHLFGFFVDKEALLAGMLGDALTASAEILTGTMVVGADNTAGGVNIRVHTKNTERNLEAAKVIIADGQGSLLAEALGLNRKRQVFSKGRMRVMGYVMEGIESEYCRDSWVNFTAPEINRRANFWMYLQKDGMNIIGGGGNETTPPAANVAKLMELPTLAPWFKNTRVVKKVAVGGPPVTYGPMLEPWLDNALAIGDAAALVESTNPGAIASGYLGVKALIEEMNGKSAMADYTRWWQQALDTNDPDYIKSAGRNFIVNLLCSNEEIDYLYATVSDHVGVPGALIAQNLDRVRQNRPALYDKLHKAGLSSDISEVKIDLMKILQETAD